MKSKCEEWTFHCASCGSIMEESPVPDDFCASFLTCLKCSSLMDDTLEEIFSLKTELKILKYNISKLLA